jgi:hypothetical protein
MASNTAIEWAAPDGMHEAGRGLPRLHRDTRLRSLPNSLDFPAAISLKETLSTARNTVAYQ